MYSTYSFLVQLAFRKKALSKLSEPQRVRLFFVIGEHFIATVGSINQSIGSGRGLLRKTQLGLIRVKVYRSSVRITHDCVGLPLSVYLGHSWRSILIKKGMVGFPLSFFV